MAANDEFKNFSSLSGPASKAAAVAPNDNQDLTTVSRAIYVGTAGDLVVTMADGGNDITFKNVPAGSLLPIRVSRVKTSTASNIEALF